jgi:predicted PurR-regulated permease PerM
MRDHHRSDILFAIAVLFGIFLAYLARKVLLIIYISALFAVVVTPAVQAIRRIHLGKWRPGRGLAVLVLLLSGLLGLALFALVALPPIIADVQGLASDWPRRAAELSQRIHRLPFTQNFDPAALQKYLASALGGVVGVFKGIAGGLFGFFSWLILTAYFILDGERAFYWAMSLFPAPQRERLEPTLLRAERRVRLWLVGQGALMLILGASSTVVFGLLRIKYFYALGVFAGIANIVPIVGPLLSVTLAGIVAAVDSGGKLAGVLIFYLIYQQVENAFLTPHIMKTTVDLPPLAVIIALSLGGALAGVLGALIAVPSAALVAVLIDEYLVKRGEAEVGFAAGARNPAD